VIKTVYYRRRRHRRRAKSTLILLFLMPVVLLVSCTAGSNASWFRGLIGADLSSYREESVIAELSANSEQASTLCASLHLLVSNNVHLQEFDSASEAVSLYRDEILNSLMADNYAAYVGNPSLSEAVSVQYPHLTASVLIPDADFESAVNRHLGLSSVSNRNGDLFTYLSRAACYITPLQVKSRTVSISVLQLSETEHTYRLGFTLSDPEGQSEAYNALFVKRDNGSAYLRALQRA